MKILLFLILSFSANCIIAQCDDSISYTAAEKESFVQVYLSLKEHKPVPMDQQLFDLATKHKITPQQYQEIQKPQNTRRALTPVENQFVSEIQKIKKDFENQLNSVEANLCDESKLTQSKFQEMKHQFRSCMRFQRSLSDYFNKRMNK